MNDYESHDGRSLFKLFSAVELPRAKESVWKLELRCHEISSIWRVANGSMHTATPQIRTNDEYGHYQNLKKHFNQAVIQRAVQQLHPWAFNVDARFGEKDGLLLISFLKQ